MRSAGYNNLDIAAAERLGIRVVYVPAYTPHAVAEHVFALTLASLTEFEQGKALTYELRPPQADPVRK